MRACRSIPSGSQGAPSTSTGSSYSGAFRTDAYGAGGLNVTLGRDPRLIGTTLSSQVVLIDPGVGRQLPIVTTNGIEMTIGG